MNVKGYVAPAMKEDLVPYNFVCRDPREDDVVIDILYSGVCHLDIQNAYSDWGGARYPMASGHEIIDRVVHAGESVTKFKVGDFVGVGCMVDSCQHRSVCEQGLEWYYREGSTPTYDGIDRHDGLPTSGGYSDKIVVTEKSVAEVPERIDLCGTVPLPYAGIITWSPLRHWQVGESSKVTVAGLGGPGHTAIKLVNALDAKVTLFTCSPGKEADARRLGASHVVFSTDSEQTKATANQFDLIIDTVPYAHDLNLYIPTLVLSDMLVLVGYLGALDPLLNMAPLILGCRSVADSVTGGIAEAQETMDFCGQYGITADVEVIDIQDISHAWQRTLKNDTKYRFIVDTISLE